MSSLNTIQWISVLSTKLKLFARKTGNLPVACLYFPFDFSSTPSSLPFLLPPSSPLFPFPFLLPFLPPLPPPLLPFSLFFPPSSPLFLPPPPPPLLLPLSRPSPFPFLPH